MVEFLTNRVCVWFLFLLFLFYFLIPQSPDVEEKSLKTSLVYVSLWAHIVICRPCCLQA